MRKAYPFILTIIFTFIIGAGYGKSNIMEKQIGAPTPDLSVTAQEVKPAKAYADNKAETACSNVPFNPFTIHLEMNQYKDTALAAAAEYGSSIGQTFITKTPVASTSWYSVDHGAFKSAKDAVTKMQDLKAKGLIPKDAYVGAPMPYAVEIAAALTKEKALKEISRARKSGVSAYLIQGNESCFRVMSGAFPNRDIAGFYEKELRNLGLPARVVPR
jgi:cell division septation protein DedD